MKVHHHSLLPLIMALLLLLSSCSSDGTDVEEKQPELRYRMAYHIANDGWVYVFDNQYREGDPDYGSTVPTRYPFGFLGINLRYRYNKGFTETYNSEDEKGNQVTKTVLQPTLILGFSDSQVERQDVDTIAKYLGQDRAGRLYTTAELLALTPEDLQFTYLDPNIFLDLLQECLTSENEPHGGYSGIPSWALFTEPIYLDDYKFQVGLIGGFGSVKVLMLDVLYKMGDGLTDYVQLYDLVQAGTATKEQVALLNALQEIEQGVVENNDLQYGVDTYKDSVIANVKLSRLYGMLKNIAESNYGQYVVHPE